MELYLFLYPLSNIISTKKREDSNSHRVITCPNCVVEKTVSRAVRAWYISHERCEGSLDPSEVSSLGKLSVFSKSPIRTLGIAIIAVLEMLKDQILAYPNIFQYN
jgi:hypothetical protein